MKDESSISSGVESSAGQDKHFKLIEFNRIRWFRGASAARVEVNADGAWLWMLEHDLQANIKNFGNHPELVCALKEYGSNE